MDRDWIDRGNQRVAQYTNLGPGQYRFRSRNCRRRGLRPGLEQGRDRARHRDPAAAVATRLVPDHAGACRRAARGQSLSRSRDMRQRAARLRAIIGTAHQRPARPDRTVDAGRPEKPCCWRSCRNNPKTFERQALEDALTGLASRRSIDRELAAPSTGRPAAGMPLGFVLLDLDRFKADQRHLFAPVGRPRWSWSPAVLNRRSRRAGHRSLALGRRGIRGALFEGISPLDEARQLLRTCAERWNSSAAASSRRAGRDDHPAAAWSRRTRLAYYEQAGPAAPTTAVQNAKRSEPQPHLRLEARVHSMERHHRDRVLDQALAERPRHARVQGTGRDAVR